MLQVASCCGHHSMMTSFHSASLCSQGVQSPLWSPSSSCLVGSLRRMVKNACHFQLVVKHVVCVSTWMGQHEVGRLCRIQRRLSTTLC